MSSKKMISELSPQEWEERRRSMLRQGGSPWYWISLFAFLTFFSFVIGNAWFNLPPSGTIYEGSEEVKLGIFSLFLLVAWVLAIRALITKRTKLQKQSSKRVS